MRKKILVFVISCLLVLGFSGIAMGIATTHTDNTGDNLVTGVDILEYSAEVYDPDPSTSLPQKIKLGLKMNGGHLPAVIVWDFDVDNNLNSGWANMTTGMNNSLCGGKCKDLGTEMYAQGWDFQLILALREQAITSTVADCLDCSSPRYFCMTRGKEFTDCDKGNCYDFGTFYCPEGDENCWSSAEGYGCDCGGAGIKPHVMDIPCGKMPKTNCSVGLAKGMWYATWGEGKVAAAKGNVYLPLNYDVTGETELCVELPWGQIVSRLHEIKPGILHCKPDLSYAMQNPPVFMVTAFFDPEFADGDDLFDLDQAMYMHFSDWAPDLPDYGVTADWNNKDTKQCDFDADGDCDLVDLISLNLNFFKGFGSSGLPACFPAR